MVRLVMAVVLALTAAAWGEELVVYTYDSFVSWGPAQAIGEAFQRAHPGVEVVWVAPGDALEVLARLVMERRAGTCGADVFLGFDDVSLPRVLAAGVLAPYDPELLANLEHVPRELRFDPSGHALPYDYGYVTFVYDSERLPGELVPATLDDLTRPELKGKIVLEDPRTSTPGLAFLLWTIAHYGDGWRGYWRRLLPNVLTVTRGWSEAYDMFLGGEAPIVLSYSTDTAYSYIEEHSLRYRVITPGGEAYREIEGMGIVAGTDQPALAHAFLDTVLSPQIQSLIPTSQWMFPASRAAELPEDFARYAVEPQKPVALPPAEVEKHLSEWLTAWQALLGGS